MNTYFTLLLILVTTQFNNCKNESNYKYNKAYVQIARSNEPNKDLKKFPDIPSNLGLELTDLTFVSGSFTSIDMTFEEEIDNISYKLRIQLTAGEKLNYIYDSDNNFKIVTDAMPCTITADEYKSYRNVLDDQAQKPNALFEIKNSKTGDYDHQSYKLTKLVIEKLEIKNNKLYAEFKFYGIPEGYSRIVYNETKSVIAVGIKNTEMTQTMVD